MRKSITILPTTRCDLRCRHCLREHGVPNDKVDIPLNLVNKALREGRELGFGHAALTGGEPAMHPRFDQLVALVHSLGYTWSVVSNGQLPERYAAALRQYGVTCTFTTVSLDGLEAEHDNVRGRGSFERALQALDFFKGLGAPISISFMLNSLNYDQLPEILELAVLKEVERLTIASVIPNASNRDLLVSTAQKETAHTFLREAQETFPIRLTFCTSLYTVEDSEKFCGLLDYPQPAINVYGEYIFCCDTVGRGARLGNLRRESFSELYLQQIKQGARLKELRRKMIARGQVFEGFNSCHFCNTMLMSL